MLPVLPLSPPVASYPLPHPSSRQCKVPSYIRLEYQQILDNSHSSFVLQARSSGLTLKGQMLSTTVQLPGGCG